MGEIAAVKARVSGPSGFTLVEVLVALGILAVAMGLIGNGFFQVFWFQTSFQDDVVATKDLRHAGSWFAGDALNAKDAVDDTGNPLVCASPATSVTLRWDGADGTAIPRPTGYQGTP
jgi:prepilin-type N-terminal cleavage/methylation domain-containing protein